MKTGIILMAFLLYAGSASAEKRIVHNAGTPPCPMIEKTQVNISFNSREADLKQIKKLMDGRINDIEAMAKEMGIEKFEMQSMNYNIYLNNPGYHNCHGDAACQLLYQLNGNMNYHVEPSVKAIDLMELLNKKGYTGGMNVNKYRSCH